MKSEINELSALLIRLGSNLMTKSPKTDIHAMRVGNLLHLIGGIIPFEQDTTEVDKFLSFFSAKKIVDSVNPQTIYFAKRISENPELMNMINEMLDLSDLQMSCDDCPAKDTCTDKHCSTPKSETPTEEPKENPKKVRKPRKPKNE